MKIDTKSWQDIEQIVQLCAKHQVDELEIEQANYRIRVQAPLAQQTHEVVEKSAEITAISTEIPASKTLISTQIGRVQLAPDAVSAPNVKVGDCIQQGDTVAYVACFGQLVPIISEQSGIIKRICVENHQAVQYGQVLFELDE